MTVSAAGIAIGSYAASWGGIAATTAATAALAGAGVSAYSQYQQGKAQNQQAKAQAAENKYQAELANERAVIAQEQGEQEAEKRSRAMAADIGSSYANWAGNGLLVDGKGKDTLTSVLNTTTAEGVADISTIRDNTAINVWTYQSNRNSLLASAQNNLTYGKNIKSASNTGAFGTGVSGIGSAIGAGASVYNAFKPA